MSNNELRAPTGSMETGRKNVFDQYGRQSSARCCEGGCDRIRKQVGNLLQRASDCWIYFEDKIMLSASRMASFSEERKRSSVLSLATRPGPFLTLKLGGQLPLHP